MKTKSTAHRPAYHKENGKTVWYCVICGQTQDELTQDCPGLVPRYQAKNFICFAEDTGNRISSMQNFSNFSVEMIDL